MTRHILDPAIRTFPSFLNHKNIIFILLIVVLHLSAGCANRKEEAKQKLAEMNITYTSQSFVDEAAKGNMKAVELFLQAGMDPNVTYEGYGTALYTAACGNHEEILKILLRYRADPNKTPFILSDCITRFKTARILLEQRLDPEVINPPYKAGPLLSIASLYYDDDRSQEYLHLRDEIFKILVVKGANVNAEAENGRTALHELCSSKLERINQVKLLLEKGADVNAITTVGTSFSFSEITPSTYAISEGHVEVVKLLLGKGANVNVISGGETPLSYAIKHVRDERKRVEIVKLLLEKGADVNMPINKYGTTAFTIAVAKGNMEIIKLLLGKGAYVSKELKDCIGNLKILATALELYATDHNGRYPSTLNELPPGYIHHVPTCPTREGQYEYSSQQNPNDFKIICTGEHAEIPPALYDLNNPRYTGSQGLIISESVRFLIEKDADGGRKEDYTSSSQQSNLKDSAEAVLESCTFNLKILATGLELYATDYKGHYPASLSKLDKIYLRHIPVCPTTGSQYTYSLHHNPADYEIICTGNHAGVTNGYPRYTGREGLITRPY